MIKVYGLKQCSTTQKGVRYLDSIGLHHSDIIDIRSTPPEREELEQALAAFGSIKKMMNTSGERYKELGLKDKLETMTKDEVINLLVTEGMLVKRPFMIDDYRVSVGARVPNLEGIWNPNRTLSNE